MKKQAIALTGALMSLAVSIAGAMGVTLQKTGDQTVQVDSKYDAATAREFERRYKKQSKQLLTYGKLRAPAAPTSWNQRKWRKRDRQQPHGKF